MKKNPFIIFIAGMVLSLSFAIVPAAYATNNQVNFDPASGVLSVTGSCSQSFVLVVIRRASDGSIWGSSNPNCVNGTFNYSITVPDADRTGGSFSVNAMDGGTPAAQRIMSGATTTMGTGAAVSFTEPTPTTEISSITIDTSSLAATADDESALEQIINDCFGVMISAFNTVKATIVAAVNVFTQHLAILPQGSITVPKGANQIAGESSLAAGATDVFIPNTQIASSSEVIITPTSKTLAPLAVTQRADGLGFHVGIATAQPAAISFTWLVVNTYSTGPQSSAQQSSPTGIAPQPVPQTIPSLAPTPTPAPDPTPVVITTTPDDGTGSTTVVTVTKSPPAAPPDPASPPDDLSQTGTSVTTGVQQ